jgi:HSP20 family molecular chaperone IbpA
MKSILLRPSLLAFALAAIAGGALAQDCTSEPGVHANTQAAASLPYTATGNILYINPFADLSRMQAAMNHQFDVLNAMWVPVLMSPPLNFAVPTQASAEASALHRTENGYQLQIKLPGFRPEDIHLQVDGRLLNITAQDSTKGTSKVGLGSDQFMRTRSFSETLTLPESVEASGMKQSVQNGILTITLPGNRKVGAGKV